MVSLGAGPLADDVFRLAHHHITGKPLLHRQISGRGLGAALLAELLFQDKITVRTDGNVRLLSTTPPDDSVAHTVLALLAAEPQEYPVRTWLTVLAETAYEQVAQRLFRGGHLRPEMRRRLLARSTAWVPTDVNASGWPAARLSVALRERRPLSPNEQALTALMWAIGLDRYVLDSAPEHTRDDLRRIIDAIWPPMGELARHTHAAIGKAVAGHRV